MSTPRDMHFGIKYAAAYNTQVTSPYFVANCADANIKAAPIFAEHENNLTPDPLAPDAHGFDYTWYANGMVLNANQLGYLLYLALGADSFATSTHTITRGATLPFANVFIDKGEEISTGKYTQTGLGAKVGELKVEFASKRFAVVSMSGMLCDLGADQDALTPSIPTAAADAALSWNTLQAGTLTIGYNGASEAADTHVRGLSITIGRDLKEEGIDLGSDQPTGLNEGMAKADFEISRAFNSNAISERDAFLAQQLVGITAQHSISGSTLSIAIPAATGRDGYEGGPGGSAEEAMATLQCVGHAAGGNELVTVSVVDGTAAAYNTL